jgi:uncharacterized protein YndB with AHSA1/START domain
MAAAGKDSKPEPTIEETIQIDAPPEVVWNLVTDLARMGEWSGQARGGRWLGGRGAAAGARFLGSNKLGLAWWVTTCKVVEFDPPRSFAFRNEQNWARWVYRLEPDGNGGTTVVHRRELPDGRAPLARAFAKIVFGGPAKFDRSIPPAMRQTLAGIKTAAEATGR